MGKSKRLPEIAFAGVAFCAFVLFIHAASRLVSSSGASFFVSAVSVVWRLCAVAVPGFIFLAGARFMLYAGTGEKFSVARYWLSRLRRVALPYIIWCTAYYAYSVLTGEREFSAGGYFFGLLTGNVTSHLYFIPLLLQFYLLAPLSLWLRRKMKLHSAVVMTLSVLLTLCFGKYLSDILGVLFPGTPYFEYSDRVFTSYLMYWSAGCFAGAAWQSFTSELRRLRGAVTVAFAVFTALNLGAVYYSYVLKRFVWCIAELTMLYNFSAIAFVLLCGLYISRGRINHALAGADAASFSVYLSHCFVLFFAELVLDPLGISPAPVFLIRLALLALWMLLLSWLAGLRLYRVSK